MKQRINIVADDGDTKVAIVAHITCRKERKGGRSGLSAGEQRGIKRTLQRRMADTLRAIAYTDFGIENIKVR